jgi:hypothetical protein
MRRTLLSFTLIIGACSAWGPSRRKTRSPSPPPARTAPLSPVQHVPAPVVVMAACSRGLPPQRPALQPHPRNARKKASVLLRLSLEVAGFG